MGSLHAWSSAHYEIPLPAEGIVRADHLHDPPRTPIEDVRRVHDAAYVERLTGDTEYLERLAGALPGALVLEAARAVGVPVAIVIAGGYGRDISDTARVHVNTARVADSFL